MVEVRADGTSASMPIPTTVPSGRRRLGPFYRSPILRSISVAVHRDDHLASLAGKGVVAASDSVYDPSSGLQDADKIAS